jgi:hypothetical protein
LYRGISGDFFQRVHHVVILFWDPNQVETRRYFMGCNVCIFHADWGFGEPMIGWADSRQAGFGLGMVRFGWEAGEWGPGAAGLY